MIHVPLQAPSTFAWTSSPRSSKWSANASSDSVGLTTKISYVSLQNDINLRRNLTREGAAGGVPKR
ncbi:MAG: hypothetical protein ACTS68_01025 [Candidatus Hodgkinia cicadicola]